MTYLNVNICLNHVLVLVLFVLLFGCGKTETTNYQNPQSTIDKRSYFSDYRDSLISVEAINSALDTKFKLLDLGRPIGVSGTPYWLITVGGWQLNNRNILLQGTAFRLSSDFYPNPVRKTEVEFEGPFTGLIRYDEVKNVYNWLFPSGNLVTGFKYQGTQDFDLIVLSETEASLDFLDVGSQQSFSVSDNSGKILDWSLDKISNSVVVLFGDDSGRTSTVKFQIISLLNSSSNEQ